MSHSMTFEVVAAATVSAANPKAYLTVGED